MMKRDARNGRSPPPQFFSNRSFVAHAMIDAELAIGEKRKGTEGEW
jgi:hypothetical protein